MCNCVVGGGGGGGGGGDRADYTQLKDGMAKMTSKVGIIRISAGPQNPFQSHMGHKSHSTGNSSHKSHTGCCWSDSHTVTQDTVVFIPPGT